jgi:uncharacterized RDD family membrane protein YckC
MGVRRLTDAPLHVDRQLLDVPLASPARRLAAFGIDLAVLVVPTVLAALLFALLAVYVRDRAAFDAGWNLLTGRAATAEERRHALGDLLPALLLAEPRGLSHEIAALVEQRRMDDALARLADYDVRLTLGEDHAALPPRTIEVSVDDVIPGAVRGMAVFLVPAAYFTLFTWGRRGATPGKRVTGIRVVRLDGHRLSALEALERFVGYLEVPGTFFTGLIDLWKDPNRRMAHDRVVHTAVVLGDGAAPRGTLPRAADRVVRVESVEPSAQ